MLSLAGCVSNDMQNTRIVLGNSVTLGENVGLQVMIIVHFTFAFFSEKSLGRHPNNHF